MRKAMSVIGVLGTLAFGAATLLSPTNAGFTVCTYKCICSVPHKCCTVNGVTSCKPAPDGPLQCTQGYNC
jgi:hypothetical protein